MRLTEHQVVTPLLLRRFELEGDAEDGNGQYYAIMLRDSGDLLVHHPVGPSLDPNQMVWAGTVLRRLNRELHHDGAWVICFTHPAIVQLETVLHSAPNNRTYNRYCLIWMDADSDVQFTQEWIAGDNIGFRVWADVVKAGIESTVQKCEASWSIWHQMMQQVLEPKAAQTFKRAKGERPASSVH